MSASFQFCEEYSRQFEAELTAETPDGASGKIRKGKTSTGGKGRASGPKKTRPTQGPGGGSKPPSTPTKPPPSTQAKTPANKGKRRATEPPPPPPPDVAELIGRAVRKRFEDKWYAGTIDSYVEPYLRVVYEDGDAEELDLAQARLLAAGVDVGVRVQYHFGSELGWIGGKVTAKHRRGVAIYEPDELAEDSTSSAMAWQVCFDDGDTENVDLCLERQSTVAQAGNWHLERN